MVKRYILAAFLILLMIPFISNVNIASAEGGINSEESRVLTVARGSFEYEGEKYVAKRYFVDQLIAYMSKDDIDLTKEQADKAIANIYANVEKGVKEGYIVKIHDDPVEGEEEKKVKEGKVEVIENGSLIAYDSEGETVMKSDGLLRNTGFSLQSFIIVLAIAGFMFVGLVIYTVKTIICSDGGRHEA